MILVDSDVWIDYLRGVDPIADDVEHALAAGQLTTSVISAAELMQGARSAKQEKAVRELLDLLEVLPFTRAAAERAGVLRRTLISRGDDIGLADCAIAAICIEGGHALWTRNERHFERVEQLAIHGMVRAKRAR